MTTGFLTPEGEPAVGLRVQGPDGARDVEAVIDTGFTGELTLTPDLIEALGLPETMEEEVVLGDGTVRTVQMHAASVVFAERTQRILVGKAPTIPLLGTDLLWGLSLRIDFWEGGEIELQKRPL
jgi:clan AA aspartic protease